VLQTPGRVQRPSLVISTGSSDVGCGTGRLTFALAEVAPKVTGIDNLPSYADCAPSQGAGARLTFEQKYAAALPYEDGAC
jgi:2-polyprenyl-3-methyl-5-hydroxy-6-metoxy-1,4-benzoquinol methylase